MSVSVWALAPGRPLREAEAALLRALLPPARRERLGPRSGEEPLWAYGLLLLALRRREGWQALPEVALGERGKPWFPGRPEVCFSLSHTAGAVVAALSDRPVGVDIEALRPINPDTMVRVAGTEDPEAFFRCWVRREARCKRTGQGVGTMLRREPPLEAGEFYRPLELFPSYAAGVASGEPGPPEVHLAGPEDVLEAAL